VKAEKKVNIVAPVSAQLIEQFLYREDAVYWIPANLDDYDPHHHISIIYDDYERLRSRIDRLISGEAWAQEPKSRVRRLISNIENRGAAENGDIEICSNFILGELRRGRQTTYFAQQVHRLRTTSDGLRIAFKKVILINNNEPIHNMTFIV
jgi:benzoate/toluate 1,2-dioxygenase beta subunit